MAGQQPTVAEQIDADEGLKSKRKMLTIASLVLLALSFADAKVAEANTFIFKITFGNERGLSILLVAAVLFLMLRYYNYASQYHRKIYRLWTERMLGNPFFFIQPLHDTEYYGLVANLTPKGFSIDAAVYERLDWGFSYSCKFPLRREISYYWHDQHDYHQESVFVGWKNYPRVLWFEAKYQFQSFVNHRESLDIIAPYILGVISISSYLANAHLQELLSYFQ